MAATPISRSLEPAANAIPDPVLALPIVMSNRFTRRHVLAGGAAGIAALGLAACGAGSGGQGTEGTAVAPDSKAVRDAEARRRKSGATVRDFHLTAQPAIVDLGGRQARTWTYGSLPGPEVRARAGDVVRLTLDNRLPRATTIHWHGIALRNDMDGVPDLTQGPVAAGARFVYEFTAPDPGTYFFHSHVGVQLDRGLYGPLIIEDPRERNAPDREFVLVLDDWTDGIGTPPDQILAELKRGGGMGGMSMSQSPGMSAMPGMSMSPSPSGESGTDVLLGGDAGDVTYPM